MNKLKFYFQKFKKFLISLFSIFSLCLFSLSLFSNSFYAAELEESDLTIVQPWSATGNYMEYGVQSSGNHALDGSAVSYYQDLYPTGSDHFLGEGNFHLATPYKRMTFLGFHLFADKPQFVLGAEYKYKYNCLMDFYFKNYMHDGRISLFVSVSTENNQGLNESFTYSISDIKNSDMPGHSLDSDGKFTINFSKMFPMEIFDSDRWVNEVHVNFYWHTWTSSSAGGTVYIPKQTYVPYFEDPSIAPIYPDFGGNSEFNNIWEYLDRINESIFDMLDYPLELFNEFIDYIGEYLVTFYAISSIFEIFSGKGSVFRVLFITALAIGILGFFFGSINLISKRKR